MKTEVSIESDGPLLVVVKRKWNFRTMGIAYDFYAVSFKGNYILYRFFYH